MINPMKFNSRGTCWNCDNKQFVFITDEQLAMDINDGNIEFSGDSYIDEYMLCCECGSKFNVYKLDGKFYPASPLKEKLNIPQVVVKTPPEYKFNNPFYKESK